MPKLSSFVKKKAETSDQKVKREEEERGHAHGGRSSAFKKTGESQVRKDRLLPGTVESGSGRVQARPAVPVPSKAPQPARPEIGIPKKTLDEYIANKVFRWPDGSLRKEKPPAKKEVVLARKDWDDLVLYCRRTGGCPDCTKGYCLRHGVGVSPEEHEKYCRSIGVWNQPLQDMKEEIYMEEHGLRRGQGSRSASSLTMKYQQPVQ